MARTHFRFTNKTLVKGKEEVIITDIAIIINQPEGISQVPLRDVKQISVYGKDAILVGYGKSNDRTYYYIIKSVHSNKIVADRILQLVHKNKRPLTPISIGFR